MSDPGERPRGPSLLPLIFRPKKIFWRPAPPPPPYLKVWIRHCLTTWGEHCNRETLCSGVCTFVFCLNSLHQSVMLGPKQPYHKKHGPETVGQQSAKDHGTNYWGVRYGSVTAGGISVIHVFSPILAIIICILKFRIVSNKTNLSYPNC